MGPAPVIDPATVGTLLERVQERSPLVHCVINSVVINVAANTLLAVGAAPAMVDVPGEAAPFAGVADGLLINLGTPSGEQRQAMREAVAGAQEAGTPWVLDPVAVGSLPVRTPLAHELVALRPDVVRGNPSEVLALAGSGSGGRGVDAADDVDSALPAARELAARTGGVVTVSGPVDAVTDGERVVRVGGGHVLLTRVTGGGCALGALVAAFVGVADDAFSGTVAALATYAVAAETSAATASGPGSFAVGLLDALAGLRPDEVAGRAQVREA